MRGRAFLSLFVPAFLFLWMIGWSLYWIGEQGTTNKSVCDNKSEGAPLIAGFVGAQRKPRVTRS